MTSLTGADVLHAILLGLIVATVLTGIADLAIRTLPRARICAWCRRVVRGGTLPATHTCCPRCLPAALKE